MDLVALLDNLKIPFEIPTLLHSPVVHFAIALPVIALLLELINLFAKKRCIGFISGFLIFLAAIVYFAAFVTGKVDGKEAYALLSPEGKEELLEHKKLGIYLVYAIGALFIVKLIVIAIRNVWGKLFFILLLAGFVAAALKQGKDGGELVFEYGANVKAVSQLDDKVMELEEQLESLKEKCGLESEKPAPAATSQESEPAKESKSQEAVSSEEAQEQSSQESLEQSSASQAAEQSEAEETVHEKAQKALEEIKGKVEGNISNLETNLTH